MKHEEVFDRRDMLPVRIGGVEPEPLVGPDDQQDGEAHDCEECPFEAAGARRGRA